MLKWVTTQPVPYWTANNMAKLNSIMCLRNFIVLIVLLTTITIAPLPTNGFKTIETHSGEGRKLFGGYRITPKHCRATKTLPISDPRANGPTICMFNHECAQRNGEVVGACMDGFLFGACCQIPNTHEVESTLIKDAQNAYYQQHNQQKLQLQQTISNPLAAQSYENYGESAQQSQETKYPNTKPSKVSSNNNYHTQQQENNDKYNQQNQASSTSGNYNIQSQQAASSIGNSYQKKPQHGSSIVNQQQYQRPNQQQQQQVTHFEQDLSSTEGITSSTDNDFEIDENLHAHTGSSNTNSITSSNPPAFHVNKHSVKISSPSSSPHNDDFVMQVLSTLPPEHENDHITFTTEVPTKIVSSLMDQLSSESNSFEEEHSATQMPVTSIDKPTRLPQQQIKKKQEQKKKPNIQHQNKQPNPQKLSNSHNHNHLVLNGAEFTHSDITHPGADAEIIEDDLQFSTGYGPQPVYVNAPTKAPIDGNYDPTTTMDTPISEDKYVLVQTIDKDQKNPTTSSSITTHVDSIESIILQLNNTNHGPTYNVINPQTSSYNQDLISHVDTATNNYEGNQGYYESTAIPTTPSPTNSYYEGNDIKAPDGGYGGEQNQQKYSQNQNQKLPAYLESASTQLDLKTPTVTYDAVYDEKDPADSPSTHMENGYPSQSPVNNPQSNYNDETGQSMEDHKLPDKNYNDAATGGHLTSEFNKMPDAVGVAYPVDMTYIEEDGTYSLEGEEQSAYGGQSYTTTTSQRPIQVTSTYDYQNTQNTYTKHPSYTTTNNNPVPSYIGMVTAQNYNQHTHTASYNQVPQEVLVSSYTTKVQEDYESASPSYQEPQSEKFTTINYVEVSTPAPITTTGRPSTLSYISSTSKPLALRPQYNPSTNRPNIITANGNTSNTKQKPKPKPSTKRPTKRPSTSNNKKGSKPQGTKKPATQPTNNYSSSFSSKKPTTPIPDRYHDQPTYTRKPTTQSTNTYQSQPSYATKKKPTPSTSNKNQNNDYVKRPTQQINNNYDAVEEEIKKPGEPQNTYQQNIPVKQPINSYDSEPIKTKQPSPSYQQQQQYIAQQSISNYDQNTNVPAQPSLSYNEEVHVASTPPKKPSKQPPNKPISTSYITGPTSPRPPTTFVYHDNEVPPLLIADDKIDSFIHSTAQAIAGAGNGGVPVETYQSTYQAPAYASSVTPLQVQYPQNNFNKRPGFVKIQSTVRPPLPTVLITPKPTVINLVTSSSWTQKPSHIVDNGYGPTTPIPGSGSTSYIYNPSATRLPEYTASTPEYVSVPQSISNDFDDPGYFGMQNVEHPAFTQSTTEATYGPPSDDRPAFPGYFGPTPTYATFPVPGEKVGSLVEEETYTSPNDFVNFPPVRNPNLNMSATQSAVTSDLELSTPAFVEDVVLKDKMNTLVHKIVESLQGNFDALADMIDGTNVSATGGSTYQADTIQSTYATTTATRKPTRKPTRVTTAKPKPTTKKPVTRVTTKRTTLTTRKPVTRRTTTRRPTTRKPTRRVTTTTSRTPLPIDEEIVDEEDEEDINPSDNEVDQTDTLSTGANGRKIQCGVRPHVKSGRIVGGKGSTFGAFPWQVLVRESTWLGLFTKNKCGGVLITSRYVITAAHCQPGFLASLVAVMGEFDISGDLESKRAVTKNVKRVIVHRQYDPATFENDLALLELDSPVQFDTHIVPICMPSDNADFTGRMATVTGWGRLKYGGGVPSVLQEVQVPIIENSVCQEMFHTAGHNKKIINSFLCAGYANGQKDSCEGDSGGPLVLQRPDGRYELAGTVSHGIKCAAPYLPGVYMRTTYYKPWLRSITGVK